GEPMVPVAKTVVHAVHAALARGKTFYPPTSGIPALKRAAARWMNGTHGSNSYTPQETLVVPGGKFGIFMLLQALIRKGDEVLIPAPYWVSYPSMVRIFGGTPRFLRSSERSGWKISASDVIKNVTRKTKILIINSGTNPTGALYSRKELGAILNAAWRKGLFVISDEVYSGLAYDTRYVSAASFPRHRADVAIIESTSKSFAMTGFRVGFVFLKDPALMKTITGLVSQSATGVATMNQWGALAALKDAKRITARVRASMRERRDAFAETFEAAFGRKLVLPPSGIYAFISLKDLGWKGRDSVAFCRRALDEVNVAIVPGRGFGAEEYVRMSFGGDPKVTGGGVRALALWIKKRGKNR
ncbi:MAG: aminotransferase class I/II-fold pyridoxal phosphate-dependent enzyme, partial [Patescibacteria group bacterium]